MFFKEIAVDKYLPDINPEVSLYNQPLLNETKQILGMLYCYYWCKEEDLDDVPNYVKTDAKKIKNDLFENYAPLEKFEGANKKTENSVETDNYYGYQKKVPWYKKLFK